MSSATSTDQSAFRPWQFFLLAGMLAATATVIVATGQSPAAIVLLSLTVVAASFVGLGVYRSLAPLVTPDLTQTPSVPGGRTRAALEREKALVLRTIKELEFDYAMKKIAPSDFDEMGGRLRSRALRLMHQLETGTGYRAEIETELAKRVSDRAAHPIEHPTDALADRVPDFASQSARATTTCAECETVNDPDARFCKSCGSRLQQSV
jgi:hypothetical protein